MYRIYYGDGSIHDGGGDTPEGRGVQAIVQDHPRVGVEIVTGCDYYVLEEGRWRGVDIFGLFDYLLESGLVLFGRTVRQEEYNAIVQQAMKDKAGWLPRERRG